LQLKNDIITETYQEKANFAGPHFAQGEEKEKKI
jgi:hypothetical protein